MRRKGLCFDCTASIARPQTSRGNRERISPYARKRYDARGASRLRTFQKEHCEFRWPRGWSCHSKSNFEPRWRKARGELSPSQARNSTTIHRSLNRLRVIDCIALLTSFCAFRSQSSSPVCSVSDGTAPCRECTDRALQLVVCPSEKRCSCAPRRRY